MLLALGLPIVTFNPSWKLTGNLKQTDDDRTSEDIRRLAVDRCAREIDFMRLLVREEKLKATSKLDSDRFGGDGSGGHGVSKYQRTGLEIGTIAQLNVRQCTDNYTA
jgi:hypothetical protein